MEDPMRLFYVFLLLGSVVGLASLLVHAAGSRRHRSIALTLIILSLLLLGMAVVAALIDGS